MAENLGEARRRRAALTVLLMSMVMVMGPTPPGTGDGVRMNVAGESAALGEEFFEAIREITEKVLGFPKVGDAVGANIDNRGAGPARRGGLDPVRLHEACFAHGGNDDIGATEDIGQIARFGMTDGDSSIGVHEEKSHGLADDVAAAEDDGVGAFDLDVVAAQNFHAARGSAGNQAGASADEPAEVDGVEAVHVFGGIDGFQDALGIDLRGKRELNQNTVDVVVAIQIFDDSKHFESPNGGGRGDESAGEADLLAGRDFAFHVELRGGIFTHKYSRKARAHARGREQANFVFQLGKDLVADFCAIEDACGHARLAFVVRREIITYRKRWFVTGDLRSASEEHGWRYFWEPWRYGNI